MKVLTLATVVVRCCARRRPGERAPPGPTCGFSHSPLQSQYKRKNHIKKEDEHRILGVKTIIKFAFSYFLPLSSIFQKNVKWKYVFTLLLRFLNVRGWIVIVTFYRRKSRNLIVTSNVKHYPLIIHLTIPCRMFMTMYRFFHYCFVNRI